MRFTNAARAKKYFYAHKLLSSCLLLTLIAAGYFTYHAFANTSGVTRYVLGTVTKGTIVSSVSASGQVSASDQLDIKPKVSGEITWIGVNAGDTVRAGQALMGIDNTDAKQAVADAEASLRTSELQYQKDTAQAPIDYQNALNDVGIAKDDLSTAYADAFNTISTAYLDLSPVVPGAENVLYGYDLSPTGGQRNADVLLNTFSGDDRMALQPFADTAESDYQSAKTNYDKALATYQSLNRTSAPAEIESVLEGGIVTDTAIAQVLQDELNFLGKVNELASTRNLKLSSAVTALQTNTKNYLATVNGDLSSLLSQKKSIDADKQTITDDENAIALMKVGNDSGTNPISLQISAANLDKQKQDLQNLEDQLADYTIVAPFDGMIASVAAKKGDEAGSAAVATIITNERIAELSLNEVDVAKIKVGDKATLTFDAVDGLTLTGEVAEIDAVGTVSQGVVSYTVKIGFSSQDTRVKPGMTVNAAIETGIKTDVLMVPSSAVKTVNGQSVVLVFNPPISDSDSAGQGIISPIAPTAVPVETGISDDTNIEIASGLSEGQQIVARTVTGTASAVTAPRTPSAGGTARAFGGGAGAVFIGR
jgi:HlyD family secretion protein